MLTLSTVPRSALLLGFAGLLPFFWGIGTIYMPALQNLTADTIGPRFIGPYVLLNYGQLILAFMSGVIWGLSTRAEGATQGMGFALSVVPALWAFFFIGAGPRDAALHLMTGFVGVLLIDLFFWRNGLAPPWWMALRIPLTALVCLCLAVPAFLL
ncbi:MAG: DUF3429 domain-containing protein [Pseudomonadota bacterium]